MTIDLAYIEINKNGYGTHGLQVARDQGLRTRLICRDPAEYAALWPDPMMLAGDVDLVETYDAVHLMRHVSLLEPDAVIAYDDYRLVQAAIIARELGLPGPDPRGVLNCRFKDLTRRVTSGIGHEVAHSLVPLSADVSTSPVGYPCVVKPTDDSASSGVLVCRSDEDFAAAVRSAIDHSTHARGYRCVEAVLAEEFIPGDEYSAELIWDPAAASWHLLGFAETILGGPPYCQEAEHVFPARLPGDTAAKVLATVEQWLEAAGHRGTAAHVEFKITASGEPALMEINPRLGGGELRRLIELTLGVDVVDLYQRLWRGLPVALPAAPVSPGKYSVIRYLNPPETGVIRELSAGPGGSGVVDSDVANIGGHGRQVSRQSRLGWVITSSDDAGDAIAEARAFHQGMSFVYGPGKGSS